MATNQIILCACFYSYWTVIVNTEAIRNSLLEKIFDTNESVRKKALHDIKQRMLKFHNFSLYRFLVEGNIRQTAHICDKCLEKLVLEKDFNFIDAWSYMSLVDAVNSPDNELKVDSFRNVAPNVGCLMSAVKKEIPVSNICEHCHVQILRCLLENDVYTINL